MKIQLVSAVLAGALLTAPALAQQNPQPQAPAATTKADKPSDKRHHRFHRHKSNISPEGREILKEAMKGQHDADDRQKLREARERVSTLLAADKLDVPALRAAMQAERQLVNTRHAQRQEALLGVLPKLSAADRKAFAAEARAGGDFVRHRMKRKEGERTPRPTPAPQPAPAK